MSTKPETLVIIGGVAGGMSAATRLRRLDPRRRIIVIERSGHVSYANCGLPYYTGGVITRRSDLLLQTPAGLHDRFRLDVRVRHEVRRIQREYVELWVGVLRGLHPDESAERLRIRAHAGFGLMNSTPHSARGAGVAPATAQVRSVLQSLALAALRDR